MRQPGQHWPYRHRGPPTRAVWTFSALCAAADAAGVVRTGIKATSHSVLLAQSLIPRHREMVGRVQTCILNARFQPNNDRESEGVGTKRLEHVYCRSAGDERKINGRWRWRIGRVLLMNSGG